MLRQEAQWRGDFRRETSFREDTEKLLGRADWLDEADAGLLRQVLGQGIPAGKVAVLAGRPTRTVQRQVRRLVERLSDPAVVCVLRHQRTWPLPLRRVALHIVVRGYTLRQTADRLGLTFHEVRQLMLEAKALIAAEKKD